MLNRRVEAGEILAKRTCQYGSDQYQQVVVSRVSPTGRITLMDDSVFNADGTERNKTTRETFGPRSELHEMTPEILAKIVKVAAVSRLQRVNWEKVPVDVLTKVLKLVDGE